MDPICVHAGGRAKHALLRATEPVTPPKPPPPFFNVALGENNLARPSLAQESVLSCGGQQIHRGRGGGGGGGGGGGREAQLLHGEVWKQLSPETIRQPLSKTTHTNCSANLLY